MKIMHERMMTDEETDTEEPNTFISRKPPWRSEKLNILFRALDERYHSSHNGKEPRRNRKVGPPSDRSPPTGVPSCRDQHLRHHPLQLLLLSHLTRGHRIQLYLQCRHLLLHLPQPLRWYHLTLEYCIQLMLIDLQHCLLLHHQYPL